MAKYIISGGGQLRGKVEILGNKNAILPCIAATLLSKDKVTLLNVPRIADVDVMLSIIERLGGVVERQDTVITIQSGSLNLMELPNEMVTKLRASLLLVGPLLSRFGRARFPHPGGDVIGKRSIASHLEGFRALGYKVRISDLKYHIFGEREAGFRSIFLDEASVTATENLIMASVVGVGGAVLKNCAREPQIIDLCRLLRRMGAKIEGAGSSTITIRAVKSLHGARFAVSSDYIEISTYAVAAALTKGEITLTNCTLEDLEPITHPLTKMGVVFQEREGVVVSGGKLKAIPKLITNIWPGFPTDLMSAVVVLATQCRGVSLLHDWMYESRMFFVDKLISMGANITISDPHRVVVYGPSRLTGRDMETPDIRAGMALLLASLVAKGDSIINRAELIERGYGNVVDNLKNLGAKIKRVD